MSTKWVPIGREFRRLRAEFAEEYGEGTYAWRCANEAILDRLATGFLTARAERFHNEASELRKPEAYFAADRTILPSFWRALIGAGAQYKRLEWVTGDFSFKDYELISVEELQRNPNLCGIESSWSAFAQGVQIEVRTTEEESEPKNSGGRKPAPWWPLFTEELVMYLQANGSPEGTGTQGQEEVYEAVCLLMRARGSNEPGRSTVLPVIGRVVNRMRTEI